MTTKEYLNRYRELDRQINTLLSKADEALLKAICVSPIQGNGGHGSGISDKVGSNIARYDYYIEQANILTEKLADIKQNIVSVLKLMPDGRYRTILYLRYIKSLPWHKIAHRLIKTQDMVCDKDQTAQYVLEVRTNLHRAALKSFTKYNV